MPYEDLDGSHRETDRETKLRRLSTVGYDGYTLSTRRRLRTNARARTEWQIQALSRNCWKKLNTSVDVVNKKLRRLSSVGSHKSQGNEREGHPLG
jgi:hypothetical protein